MLEIFISRLAFAFFIVFLVFTVINLLYIIAHWREISAEPYSRKDRKVSIRSFIMWMLFILSIYYM